MGLKNVEDAIVAEIRTALTVGGQLVVRQVDSLPGDWDAEMLKRLLRLVPGVFVAFIGGPAGAASGETAAINARWSVIAATGHASGEAARRRGDSQQVGAYELIERLLPKLHGHTIADEGTLKLIDVQNLYTGEIDKQGLAVYAATFELPNMAMPSTLDEATLTPFATFDAKYDFAPRELFLDLPGGAGNGASTPDSVALSFAGDRGIPVRAALNDWTPAAESVLMGQWGVAGQNAWKLSVLPGGLLRFSYSTDGANAFNRDSTAATGFQDGTAHWVKPSVDVDDGAGNHVVNFLSSDDYDPATGEGTWTPIGVPVVTAGAIAIFDSNAALGCGFDSAGASSCIGKVYRGRLLNGIDGALAADFRADDATPNTVAFKSLSTAETWTLNGTATIASEFQAEDTVSLPQS